jgi:predicted metal-dependent phosphoesterase TrpH
VAADVGSGQPGRAGAERGPAAGVAAASVAARCFVDLHCHTSASFDSLSDPVAVVRAAAKRGLTHLAITDHDRIEGALRARDAAPAGLSVIVGEEVKTADGDLVALFLERAIPPGLPAEETVDAIRAQGGLAGIPHPFDRFRFSGMAAGSDTGALERLAPLVDFVEAHNARVPYAGANDRAAAFAREHGLPGIAVSDAHTVMEVGIAYSVLYGPVGTAAELRSALAGITPAVLVRGRGSILVRGFMPVAKAVQRLRGNRRVPTGGAP